MDLRLFVAQWLDENCLEPGCIANLNGLDGVDAVDYAILAQNWLTNGNGLVISEFMASNHSSIPLAKGELLDKDGDSSDWIEIYNSTDQAADLGSFYLTDDINDPDKWKFPESTTIGPGSFLLVFASGKNIYGSELHTNFQLDAGGGYIALVKEDGKTAISEYDYPEQLADISYGLSQLSGNFITSGDIASYYIPQTADSESQWTKAAFDDSSWKSSMIGIGFANATGDIADITAPGDLVQGVPPDGDWPGNESPPLAIDDNVNNKYLHFKGDFDPTDPPDGAGLQVTPSTGPTIVTGLTFTTANDAPERDPTAFALYGSNTSIDGPYTLIATGDIVDFAGASEWPRYTRNTTPIEFPNNTAYYHYQLLFPAIRNQASAVAMQIGEVELMGCSAASAASDIQDEMLNINTSLWLRMKFDLTQENIDKFDILSLLMKYEDGFVAYLNGVEVARDNFSGIPTWNSHAETDRADDHVENFVNFDISNHINLLSTGSNVLAVQALNDNISDENFFILPELSAAGKMGINQYFSQPTPGTFNVSGAVDVVSDTKFSKDRGFYDEPFSVEITTDTTDVTIHYTIDGSCPTETYGLLYTGPIQINGTTCLRAMAFRPGWLSTNVDTQTYIFLDQVIRQPSNPQGFPSSWGSTTADYEMDQRIVNDPQYSSRMRDSLLSIPSMSIVTDIDNLFGPSGIYENSNMEGAAWERPASIEWINPDGSDGFQIDAGIRAYGGAFRRMDLTRKKTFRLLFKTLYGAGKLKYHLFDDPGATESFDTIILRAGSNDAWNNWGGTNTQYIIDEFMRRSQLALGQHSSHGRFVHLYVNGLYWGLYNPVERPEQSFSSTYYGGEKENWDAINAGDPVGESTTTTWNAMLNQIRSSVSTNEPYQKIQGNNPDGTNNPDYDNLIDIDNYIDYLFINFWAGTGDWGGRNWYVACRKPPESTGFKFFNWDSEGAIVIWSNLNSDVTNASGTIQEPYQGLRQNLEFRMLFADHAQRHLFNDGAATSASSYARYKELSDEVEAAVIAESARWGDQAGTLYTQGNWQNMRDYILETYMPQRPAIALQQLRGAGLYPEISAPVFKINDSSQHGGYIDFTDKLSMFVQEDVLYIDTELVGQSAPVRIHIPLDNSLGESWAARTFEPDTNWSDGSTVTGVGYEKGSGYQDMIGTDISEQMYGKSTSVFARIEFDFDGSADFDRLLLRMKYDDGFVAYLNGTRICTSPNVTNDTAGSAAAGGHEASASYEDFDITGYKNLLVTGTNVLAVHGINITKTSSDMLILPILVGKVIDTGTGSYPVWYTLDGSDPRLVGGDINSSAVQYSGIPFSLTMSGPVRARTLYNGNWSALNEALFAVSPVRESLRITEIMYHSADPNAEYIELKNIGNEVLNLNMVQFTKGIDFEFGPAEIDPGQYIVLVGNQKGFSDRYPDFAGTISGKYEGSLDNNDDKICLMDAAGKIIHEFTYRDGWYDITDGDGFSLTVFDPYISNPDTWDTKAGWRPSALHGGSPGYDDSGMLPAPGSVVINEVLAHSHAENPDWIELHNTADAPVNIGGWYLSDSNKDDPNKMKYQIELGTEIPANGYIVFYENQTFGKAGAPGAILPFGLSEGGDMVHLQSADGNVLTGYEIQEVFGASMTNVAFGRHIKSTVDEGVNFVAMSMNTPGSLNAYPMVGPVIISEIMYNPGQVNTGDEYIELHNITDQAVILADEVSTEIWPGVFKTDIIQWKFSDGITFTFPAETAIPPHGYLILAKDMTAFANYYGQMPEGVNVIPMGVSSLNNGGERLQIVRPGDMEYGKQRYWIRVDRVNYESEFPWPETPNGEGLSLSQKTPDIYGYNYGNDAANWQATTPNPGI